MDFDDGVQFDPGFIQHITAFVPNIEYVYDTINKFKNFGQKKLQFKMYYPKIQSLMQDYIGFYLGCMLWASYSKTMPNKTLLNNLCFGGEYSETETLEEVDFIEKYTEQLKKDVKYYLGQNFTIETQTMNIISAYRDFLKINEGFTQTKTTDDIKLPVGLKTPEKADYEIILKKIEKVVDTGKLTELYPLAQIIL